MNVKTIRKLKKISNRSNYINSNSESCLKYSYIEEINNKQNIHSITKKQFVRIKYSHRYLIFTIPKKVLQSITNNMIYILQEITYTYGDVLHYESLKTLLDKIYTHYLKKNNSKMFDFIKIINIIALYYYEYDAGSNVMKQLDSFTRYLFSL